MVNMTNKEYSDYVKLKSPNSHLGSNMLKAFISGGIICAIAQGIVFIWRYFGADAELSVSATSVTMIFIGALLTGLGIYDRIARFAGAGSLVPITGFANSVVSPALEFKAEGFIAGMSAKMFVIAGPVIVFGLAASVIYGILFKIFA